MKMDTIWLKICAVAVLVAILLAAPYLFSEYYVGLIIKMLIFALFAMSLDLLLGYTGLPSLGHAAYFGVAAYITGILAASAKFNVWLALPAGIIGAMVVAAVFAFLALRTRGSYFLMITLALSQVMWGVAMDLRSLTGGEDGLPDVPKPDFGLPWSMYDTTPFYYFVLVVVAVSALIIFRIVKSPFGYTLKGIRESESRMLALGYKVFTYQFMAFILAAAFAGLAGCLYVYFNRFVGPDYLHVARSAEVLLMVILGGAGTLIGPAIGAAVIVLLENVTSTFTERWLLVLGVVYVIVALFAPAGLVGLVKSICNRGARN